jgi:hypothetical protein
MKESAVLQGSGGRRFGVLLLALLAGAALFSMAAAGGAGAARLVGKNGKVYACYRTKGKAKGEVRLVAQHKKCGKGEKKISWNVTGKHGSSGQDGESAPSGETGEPGGPGAAGLAQQVSVLTSKVTALEGVLKGVTNTDLTGVLSKLQGVTGTQLKETVTKIADVNALCAQGATLTAKTKELGTALMGVSLTGLASNPLFSVLGLSIPSVPALPAFACP